MIRDDRPPAFVLLNPAAGSGRTRRRWATVAPVIAAACEPRVVELDAAGAWEAAARQALGEGVRLFLAAGGDGTVGTLADALVRLRGTVALPALTLGAAGLGSSNDFHKPFARVQARVPLRIGRPGARRDVCRARFTAAEGPPRERHFLVSASLGLAARANAFFSGGDRLQGWLRGRWTAGAILYAAQHTLVRHRNLEARLQLAGGHSYSCALTNLSVGKTAWVSGGFRYDTSVAPDDGLLAANLCEGMTRTAAGRALADLARGRFQGRPGRRHWQLSRLEVELPEPTVLELDGELFAARRVSFETLPDRLQLCS
jgi:diacylglycerol kinase (ATP)